MAATLIELDRLAMRARPPGSPVMHQNWEKLLFLHWPVDPELIRPLIPEDFEIDTYDGQAWIGLTPFAMTDVRLISMPAIPGLDSLLELNVRTYVHYRGKPGIWFLSLDASKLLPAVAARLLFALPYYKASMEFTTNGRELSFFSHRTVPPFTQFRARWEVGDRLREPHLDSLAFFLAERYAFFAGAGDNISMTRVYHAPWILDEARVLAVESSMLAPFGLAEPAAEPLAHFSRFVNVEVWPPQPV